MFDMKRTKSKSKLKPPSTAKSKPPDLCWFHGRIVKEALSCKPPCSFSGNGWWGQLQEVGSPPRPAMGQGPAKSRTQPLQPPPQSPPSSVPVLPPFHPRNPTRAADCPLHGYSGYRTSCPTCPCWLIWAPPPVNPTTCYRYIFGKPTLRMCKEISKLDFFGE